MVESEGPKWKHIVKKLPGRTVSSVRNRWQRIEKGRKLREEGQEFKNRCHACGQPKRGHICTAKMRGGPQVMPPSPPPSPPRLRRRSAPLTRRSPVRAGRSAHTAAAFARSRHSGSGPSAPAGWAVLRSALASLLWRVLSLQPTGAAPPHALGLTPRTDRRRASLHLRRQCHLLRRRGKGHGLVGRSVRARDALAAADEHLLLQGSRRFVPLLARISRDVPGMGRFAA